MLDSGIATGGGTLAARLRRGWRRLAGRGPIIHLYALCWNEARLLQFFFRHYDPIVDRYFIHDHESSDGSAALLAGHPRVTLGSFRVDGASFVAEGRAFYETAWHASRGEADWVIVVNIDELLFHPRGRAHFAAAQRAGATILPARGYEMIADRFPAADAPLMQSVTRGLRAAYLDKLCAFQPDAVERINYGPGRHGAAPRGRIVAPAKQKLKLLHYKYLGDEYLVERYRELDGRMRAGDRSAGAGRHYATPPEELRAQHRRMLASATPVPGL